MSENALLCLFVVVFWGLVWAAARLTPGWAGGHPTQGRAHVPAIPWVPVAMIGLGCLLNWFAPAWGSWVVVFFHVNLLGLLLWSYLSPADSPRSDPPVGPLDVDQDYLDYAEGVPAAPDQPAAVPVEIPVRPDPVRTTAAVVGGLVGFGVVVVLDAAGVSQLRSPWWLAAYGIGFYAAFSPILAIGCRLSPGAIGPGPSALAQRSATATSCPARGRG